MYSVGGVDSAVRLGQSHPDPRRHHLHHHPAPRHGPPEQSCCAGLDRSHTDSAVVRTKPAFAIFGDRATASDAFISKRVGLNSRGSDHSGQLHDRCTGNDGDGQSGHGNDGTAVGRRHRHGTRPGHVWRLRSRPRRIRR